MQIKPLFETEFREIRFQTQVGALPEASKYLSVLLTNEDLKIIRRVDRVDRRAVYDGVISFNDELVFFLETKPNRSNVWEDQLCPAAKDIPEGAELISVVVVLQWKQIIDVLFRVNKNVSTPHSERLLISDFFGFINSHFDYLNPYNDFSKCHSNYLATKRIEQILREISVNEDKVRYHQGWGLYVELDLAEVKKIAILLHNEKDKEWDGISIACEFASTVSQARSFYQNITSFDVIQGLGDWEAYC